MASGRLGFGGSWTTGAPRRGPRFTTTSGIGSFGRPPASKGSGLTELSRSQLLQEKFARCCLRRNSLPISYTFLPFPLPLSIPRVPLLSFGVVRFGSVGRLAPLLFGYCLGLSRLGLGDFVGVHCGGWEARLGARLSGWALE